MMRRGSPQRPGGADAAEFVLELPSDPDVIEGAVSYLVERLESFAFQGPRVNLNFRVGVTEALANAVLYGNASDPAKSVRIEVVLDRNCVSLQVEDEGGGFNPDSVDDPTLPPNIERPGGRGIFLIRQLMDEVEFNERGNCVRMRLFRSGEDATAHQRRDER